MRRNPCASSSESEQKDIGGVVGGSAGGSLQRTGGHPTIPPRLRVASGLLQLPCPTQAPDHQVQQLPTEPHGAQGDHQQEQEDAQQVLLIPQLLEGVELEVP